MAISIDERAAELYAAAEKSGADYTRRSTVRRKLISEGYPAAESEQAAERVPSDAVGDCQAP